MQTPCHPPGSCISAYVCAAGLFIKALPRGGSGGTRTHSCMCRSFILLLPCCLLPSYMDTARARSTIDRKFKSARQNFKSNRVKLTAKLDGANFVHPSRSLTVIITSPEERKTKINQPLSLALRPSLPLSYGCCRSLLSFISPASLSKTSGEHDDSRVWWFPLANCTASQNCTLVQKIFDVHTW